MVLPKVSICIPVYNGEKTILRAIRSAARQTYPNLEIVVSDNCSTDNTVKLIASNFPRQNNLNLIVRDRNYGVINNFMHVVESAQGEYVMTMGADDELSEEAVTELVNMILENHAIAAFGKTNKINADGSINVVSFGQYKTERELIRGICSEEKINYLICGLWRTDIYRRTFSKLAKGFSDPGTSPDRLFVFFALFNYGVNYRLSDKIVYNKYYESTSNRINRPLIKSKLLSIINAIFIIQKNRRKTFLYSVFLPRWIVFQVVTAFKSRPIRLKNVRRLLVSFIKNNIKPETRQKLKAIFRR